MVRPRKEGLDYFPLDVNMDQDDKVFILEAECGTEGFAIYIKLLMRVYETGYYTKWTERDAKVFAKKKSLGVNVVNNVVNVCINEGLFDKEMYEKHCILTSHGIQKRYFRACGRRTKVQYVPEYIKIDVSEYKNLVSVYKNSESPGENDDSCPQSKAKNSKAKNSKAHKKGVSDNTTIKNINNSLMEKFGGTFSKHQVDRLVAYVENDGFEPEMVIQAIEMTAEKSRNGKAIGNMLAFAEGILQNWDRQNVYETKDLEKIGSGGGFDRDKFIAMFDDDEEEVVVGDP